MSQDRSKSYREFIGRALEKALQEMMDLPRDIVERILPSTAQIAEDAYREAGQDKSLFSKLLKEKLEKCCKSALGPQEGRELAGKLWTAMGEIIKSKQQQQLHQHQQQQQQHQQHLQQQQHQPPVFSPYQQQQQQQQTSQQPQQLQMSFTGQQQFAGQQQYHPASNPGNYNGMAHTQPPQQHNIQMQHAAASMMPSHGAYQQQSQATIPSATSGFQMYHNQVYGGQNFHSMSQSANGNGTIGFMNNAGSSYPNGSVVNGYINPTHPPSAIPHVPSMSGANQQGGSTLPVYPPMQQLNPPPSMSVPQPVQTDSSGAAPAAPAAKQTKPRQPRKSKADKEKEATAKATGTTMAMPGSESEAQATAAMAIDESPAVEVSPPAPTVPPEDDDGTERPVYSEREFNVTDGRVVQASEFDADRIASEEDIARQLARRQLSERIYDESVAPSEPTRLHLVNMFDVECVLQKVNQRLGSHMTMSDGARRLLSAAIQQHLCTTVESSIVGARSRYQFSASRHFSSLKDHFAKGESVTSEQLGDFAFRFGPDVRTVLVNEHKKAEYLVNKFNESDRFKLIEDMKDHMSRVAFSGGKRRAENLDMSWKQVEDTLAREGRLTMEQLATYQFKLQTFQPYVRDVTSLKAVTNDGSEVPPVTLLADVPPLDQHKNQEVLVQAKDFYKVLRDVRGMQGEKIVSRSFARRHGL